MLKVDVRTTIETLLKRGKSQRQIAHATGVARNTISSHLRRKTSKAAVKEPIAAEVTPAAVPAPAVVHPTASVQHLDCKHFEPTPAFGQWSPSAGRP